MKKVRIGIVGLGNMGTCHATNLLAGKVPWLELTAVAAPNPFWRARAPGVARSKFKKKLVPIGTSADDFSKSFGR